MAFNFYGTFTTGQFNKFMYFSKLQEQDLRKRIAWLDSQLLRVGIFTTEYNENNFPLSFTVSPDYSYGAKLLLAYKILGGVPEEDMLLRTRDLPVYLTRGVDLDSDPENFGSGVSNEYTNGRLNRGTIRFDRDLGIQVQKVKNWQHEVIKRKRENLEFKIKRTLDLSDQLQQERNSLNAMIEDPFKSLDFMFANVSGFINREGAMNVVDNLADIWGLKIGNQADITLDEDYRQSDPTGERVQGGVVDQAYGINPKNPLIGFT
jgi:hypothetical protein